MLNREKVLYLVIPCYNEIETLDSTSNILNGLMKDLINKKIISSKSRVLYVNDGSKDDTWGYIKALNKRNKMFTGISLANNVGQQNALACGLLKVKDKCDIAISLDCDLQDDHNAIYEMIKKYNDGNDIVYGVRNDRRKDSFLKRTTSKIFYKMMKFFGANIIEDHSDFRLVSKKVLLEFDNFDEVNLFLRALFPLMGFKHDFVYYERQKRNYGKSKYSVKKMVNLAVDGITSFCVKPLRFIFLLGLLTFLISIVILIYCLVQKFSGNTVEGWTFIVMSIWLLCSLIMLSLGVIGEYVGKLYMESKHRPRYIIDEDLT